MVKVAVFDNETEAFLAKNFLLNKEIRAEIVGSKEYTAHILGGGAGHFELLVEPIDLLQAQKLLAGLEASAKSEGSENADHFRRAVFYAFVAGLVLPVIFNYASIMQGLKFWRASDKRGVAICKMLIVLALQSLAMIWLTLVVRSCT